MDTLVCPVCKAALTVIEHRDGEVVIANTLFCGHCDEHYPIADGIPNLLPPAMRRPPEPERL